MTEALVRCLRESLGQHADARIAAAQFAYMKGIQAFRGVRTPERRALLKDCLARHRPEDFAACRDVVQDLWRGRYREERLLALDVAARFKHFRTHEALPLFEDMLRDADWWDVLDPLAIDLLGGLLAGDHVTLRRKVCAWRRDSRLWTRRAALLVQLKYRQNTNVPLLAETILVLAGEQDFFIRKAIGWALREYSKTDPSWVRDFVTAHERELAPLSRREALKRIA